MEFQSLEDILTFLYKLFFYEGSTYNNKLSWMQPVLKKWLKKSIISSSRKCYDVCIDDIQCDLKHGEKERERNDVNSHFILLTTNQSSAFEHHTRNKSGEGDSALRQACKTEGNIYLQRHVIVGSTITVQHVRCRAQITVYATILWQVPQNRKFAHSCLRNKFHSQWTDQWGYNKKRILHYGQYALFLQSVFFVLFCGE